MPTGQQYATDVPQTSITGQINATATAMNVASGASFPTTPFTAILEIGTALQEPIDVTSVGGGTNWTIVRAIDGTTGFTHNPGATVTHGNIGRDFREPRSHIDSSGPTDASSHSVHGLTTGAVVGTSETQTLTNKTLTNPILNTPSSSNGTFTSPAITSATFSGAQTMGAGAWTGTGSITEPAVGISGITGVVGNSRFVGIINGGPPGSGTFSQNDVVLDNGYNIFWICISAGSPGTWTPVGIAHLGTTILGASAASITVNVPAGIFNHLEVIYTGRQDSGSGGSNCFMRLNGDSGNNYTWQYVRGSGATASAANSGAATNQLNIGVIPGSGDTANYFGTGSFVVGNISSAVFKPVASHFGSAVTASNGYAGEAGGLWASTATVSSVTLLPNSGNLVAGSSLTVKAWA